jgi:hypothetical protein
MAVQPKEGGKRFNGVHVVVGQEHFHILVALSWVVTPIRTWVPVCAPMVTSATWRLKPAEDQAAQAQGDGSRHQSRRRAFRREMIAARGSQRYQAHSAPQSALAEFAACQTSHQFSKAKSLV